ncbi:O-antigen ligase family protein [Cryobacterium sp. AP23]
MLASVTLLPAAFDRWFLPKDAVAAVAVLLASLAVARGRLPRWFVVAAAVAAALALVGVLLSAAPDAQLWGRWPRYEGLVALPVYFGAVWAGARLFGPDVSGFRLRSLPRAVATAAIALGAVSLLESFGERPFTSDQERPGALTGNATDQGLLGALFLALLVLPVLRAWTGTDNVAGVRRGAARVEAERAWLTGGLVMALVTVVVSASRSGLLAAAVVVVVLGVLAVLRAPREQMRRVSVLGIGALLLLAGGALLVPFTRDRVLGSSPLAGQSAAARLDYWRQAVDLVGAHPFGVGASGFLNANAGSAVSDSTLDSPHNWLLQVALAGGIPLLLVVLGIAAWAVWKGARRWWRLAGQPAHASHADLLAAALAGLAGYGVGLLTHFTAPATAIPAALLLGVLLAVPAEGGWRANPRRAGAWRVGASLRTGLLALWVVWLIVLTGAEVPLAEGVAAARRGDVPAAEAAFGRAQALRPWDADLASIAAQSFAALADGGVAEAAAPAVVWAERSRMTLPGTVATEKALVVGQLASDDLNAAAGTLANLAVLAPRDSGVAAQYAVALYLQGDLAQSRAQVDRALGLDPADELALRVREALDAPTPLPAG